MGPSAAYNGADSGDDYLSDDAELSDNDLNLLNTDYNDQRDLTFFPSHGRPYPRPSNEKPSHLSEKHGHVPVALNVPSIPPRDASLRHRESLSRHDTSDPQLPYRPPPSRAYQYPRPRRRPLVDYIKNEWQQAALNTSTLPSNIAHSDTPAWIRICFAPRFQRGVMVISFFFLLGLGCWIFWAGPKVNESYGLRQSALERMKDAEGWFGQNMRPEFADMTQLDALHENLVPGAALADPERRLIFVGDVHGCNDELNAVLTATEYRPKTDHLIFTGDMIAKGPNSAAVLNLAISHNASCVRGNHEDRVLLTYRDLSLRSLPPSKQESKGEQPPPPGVPPEAAKPEYQTLASDPSLDKEVEEFSRLDIAERALARQLTQKHISYLLSCPTILSIPPIPGIGPIHVVHAGLIPSVPLSRQDPFSVMYMRTVDLETHVPSSKEKGTPWWKLWNKYQSLLPSGERATVVYGHDSKRGLQLKEFSKGLDTGCVNGGKLTALVVDGTEGGMEVVDVGCKDYRHLEKDLIKSAESA